MSWLASIGQRAREAAGAVGNVGVTARAALNSVTSFADDRARRIGQALHARVTGRGHSIDDAVARFFDNFDAPDDKAKAMAEEVARGVATDRVVLDEIVQRNSLRWKIPRMAMVDRNILRLATWELRADREGSARVVIDEAVEIAKRYGAEQSGAFVNGVLDSRGTKCCAATWYASSIPAPPAVEPPASSRARTSRISFFCAHEVEGSARPGLPA